MPTKPISKRGARLTMLAAKTLLGVLATSLFLVWLGFGQGAGELGSSFRRQFTRSTGFCLSCKKSDVDPSISFVKSAIDSGAIAVDLESAAKAFAAANGLQIQLDGDNFHYLLFANNDRIELFVTPATVEGLKSADDLLSAAISQKIAALGQAPYLAAFAVENELVENQKSMNKDGTSSDTGKLILARRPRLYELYGVEAAMKRSRPSQLAAGDQRGLKFYFLKDSLYKEEGHFAYFTSDKDDRPAIYVTAGTTDGLRATELDAPSWALSTRYGRDGTFFDTVESLLVHEMAHNHQERMGWEKDAVKQKAMNEALGFSSYVDGKTQLTVYLIQVKAAAGEVDTTTAPRYFRLGSRSAAEKDKRWYRTDAAGVYLDARGQPVDSEAKAQVLTNKEVQLRAVVPPASNYFDTPTEVFAEALKAVRLGGDIRQSLFTLSPGLYKLARDQDQKELNLAYGYVKVVEARTLVKADHESALDPVYRVEPTYMRGWDGLVVPFSRAAENALADAEAKAQLLSSTTPQGKS